MYNLRELDKNYLHLQICYISPVSREIDILIDFLINMILSFVSVSLFRNNILNILNISLETFKNNIIVIVIVNYFLSKILM